MSLVLLYALTTTAFWYLGAAADLTYTARAMLPEKLNRFLLCSACAGTWYGAACGTYGVIRDWPFLGLTGGEAIIACALCAMIWTPFLAALLMKSFEVITRALAYDVESRNDTETNTDSDAEAQG